MSTINTNLPPAAFPVIRDSDTVMSRVYQIISGHESSISTRLLLIIAFAILSHLAVKLIRHIGEWSILQGQKHKTSLNAVTKAPKFITLTRLIVSSVTFGIYFFSIGLILQEFGVNLTAYLASASVIGLAISFGSQGLVQDMVIGVTLIFSDTMEVGDLVELTGTSSVIGTVDEIGLRFTKLVNFYSQEVYIPNRTIANVSRFPDGGVFAYADVQVPENADQAQVLSTIKNIAAGMHSQFGAIILKEPVVDNLRKASASWGYFRVHFKIWPGQGALIESTFKHQVVCALRLINPCYEEWQVPVTYRATKNI